MVKAIFFDIDGTLVSFKNHQIPKSTFDALYKLKEKGIKLFIATGRGKDGRTRGRSCERFWLGYGFSCSIQISERELPDTGVCNEFRTSVLGILVVESPD